MRGSKFNFLKVIKILKLPIVIIIISPIEPPGSTARVLGGYNRNNTKMTVTQPEMIRFSFCKKGFEGKSALYHLGIWLRAVLLDISRKDK